MATCGIILPSGGVLWHGSENGEELPECLLHEHHGEQHLCLIDGRYILWESSSDCACVNEGILDCDCYDYSEITKKEAFSLIAITQGRIPDRHLLLRG